MIRWLAELGRADVASAGGKGANLGELVRAGFPVPGGFVVTTEAFDAFVDPAMVERIDQIASGVTVASPASATNAARAIADEFERVPVPAEIADLIRQAYAHLGNGPVAVRSSATAEDLAEASFAGQQDTFLNVTTADGVVDAVRACWASLYGERALAYRARLAASGAAVPAKLGMAVVVQRLVPASASGVLFTVNPVSGSADEVVIDAVRGLGEALVAGLVTPDTYVVTGDTVTLQRGDQTTTIIPGVDGVVTRELDEGTRRARVLTDAQVRLLATLGRQVARHFRAPQDIEWALDAGTAWLLQARPVTTAVRAVAEPEWLAPKADGLYFRASIVEQLPDPLTPLFADLTRVAVPAGLVGLMARIGVDLGADPGIDFVTINGYAYYEYTRAAFMNLLRKTPSMMPALFGHLRHELVNAWEQDARPRYRRLTETWAARPVANLSAAELVAGATELLAGGCAYYATVQTIIPQSASAEMTFATVYDRLAKRGDDPASTVYLLGYDSQPIQAEKDAYALARWVRAQPRLARALADAAFDPKAATPPAGVSGDVWAEWSRRLGAFLADHGHTVFNLDFANPVPADDPRPVIETLRFFVADSRGDRDPVVRQRRAAAERERATQALLNRVDPIRRRLLTTTLRRAQETAPQREDALADVGLGWPALRAMLLEVGRRLTAQGVLERSDDVFWLRATELDDLAARLDDAAVAKAASGYATPLWPPTPLVPEGEIVDLRGRLAERRQRWTAQKSLRPPGYLPRRGMLTLFEQWMPAREGDQTGRVLRGLGASAGAVEGRARLVASPDDLSTMRPGEILVASITTPAFTPLFALAAGVVTDVGGLLSHSSIVAREYGIPAVLGIGVATQRIATGDRIRVDGTNGTVTLLDVGLPVPEPRRAPARRNAVAAVAAAALAGAGVALLRWARR